MKVNDESARAVGCALMCLFVCVCECDTCAHLLSFVNILGSYGMWSHKPSILLLLLLLLQHGCAPRTSNSNLIIIIINPGYEY